ncbi:hypothetical protein PV04_00229 [Phialophora macrospora]|uniref:Uncharacterized protein n=1 Tax=Phialophora macrospora TaxID=1851006 RepID=A0A0D2FZW9_9EURO|nr:hypothetical protein PV04_00229 [Phialophora macrospora]
MAPQKPLDQSTLAAHLHSIDHLADRLLQAHGKMRRSQKCRKKSSRSPKRAKRKDGSSTAVRKLEKEMDRLTDPTLLHDARVYQEGLTQGTDCFLY